MEALDTKDVDTTVLKDQHVFITGGASGKLHEQNVYNEDFPLT